MGSTINFGIVFCIIFFLYYFFPPTKGQKTRYNIALVVRVHPALYSPILVHLFSVSYNNVTVSRLHAINSVLTNTTTLYKFFLVCPPFIVPGSKIPTKQLPTLFIGSVKHIPAYSQELRCGRVPYSGVQ